MRWPVVLALLLLLRAAAAAATQISPEQLQANEQVVASATAAYAQGVYTTAQQVEGNETLLAVPCTVISPSPLCIQFCHQALADASLAPRFHFQLGSFDPLWVCVMGVWGVTVPASATNAKTLQAILTGSASLSTPIENTGACRPGYVGSAGSCTAAPDNHVVVAQDLSRVWTSSTVTVAVPCGPLTQSMPVASTLCPDPSSASTARGCGVEIPVYATHCAQCPIDSGQGIFGFRSQGQRRCQPGLWGQQPTVQAGSNVAVAANCGPAAYQHPGQTLRLLDPTAAAAINADASDLPRTAMGLCLPCAQHHGSTSGQQCEPCAAGTHRTPGLQNCVSCPAPTQQSKSGGPCFGCPAGWIPTLTTCEPCPSPLTALTPTTTACAACPSDQVPVGVYWATPPVIRSRSPSTGAVVQTINNTTLPFTIAQCVGYPLPRPATKPCPPGYGFSSSHKFCIQCWTGTWSDGGSCRPCDLGTFSNTAGRASRCTTKCPAGQALKSNVRTLLEHAWGSMTLAPLTASWFDLPVADRLNSTWGYNLTWADIGPYAAAAPASIPSTTSSVAEFIALPTSTDPALSCEACAPGTYATPGMTDCIPCGGTTLIAPEAGMSACVACASGLRAAANKTVCVAPELTPTYPVANASTTPAPCTPLPGHIVRDAILCAQERCADGSQPAHNQTHCVPCAAGSFSRGTGVCSPCAPGTHAPAANATSCALCQGRTVATSQGATACTECPASEISVSGRFCRACGVNTAPSEDGRSCSPCPTGTHRPAGAPACSNCTNGFLRPGGRICVSCVDLLFYDGNCSRCADTHVSPMGAECELAPLRRGPQLPRDSNLGDEALSATGFKPIEGTYNYVAQHEEMVVAVTAAAVTTLLLALRHERRRGGVRVGTRLPLTVAIITLACADAIGPPYTVSPAYEPLPHASSMDSISYLQSQVAWAMANDTAPSLQGKLHWLSRLRAESSSGSGAIIDPVYDGIYMSTAIPPSLDDRRFIAYSASVLGTLGPMCTHVNGFCIEMCCAVGDRMKEIVGTDTHAVGDAWLQAWGWCAYQPVSAALRSALQTTAPCDALGTRSQLWCSILSSPYSFYAGAPPSDQDTGPKQCRLGYMATRLLTRGGLTVYPCVNAWPSQLVPPLGALTAYSNPASGDLATLVDKALPAQITAWCPPGHTSNPAQATTCSSSLHFDPSFNGLFVCPGGCCGQTTAAFSCVRCHAPSWVDPYTGACMPSLSPNPVVLPLRMLSLSAYYARVTLKVDIPAPVAMRRTEPPTPCPRDHELHNDACIPCVANHQGNGMGECTPCTGNTYRHASLYQASRTIGCALNASEIELYAFETTVTERTPIEVLLNGTQLKEMMSPVRRPSCEDMVNAGCVPSPAGMIAVPGGNPVRCPQYSSGPGPSYIGLGWPVAACMGCPRSSSWLDTDTGICQMCSGGYGTIGFVKPSNYSAGEWMLEKVENATVAQARWNPGISTRIVSETLIEAFYSDLPGGVWAAACGNATTRRQGRERVESTYVLCPAGTFALRSKCYACPDGSYSSGVGAIRCTLIEPGWQMPSLWPYRAYAQNLSIPLLAMANRCNSSMPDILGCTHTYSWRLPFLPPNVTTTRSGTFTLLDFMQDTGLLRTSNASATLCPAGTRSVPMGNCVPCAENWYQPSPGSSSCLSCPPRYFTNFTVGAAQCTLCPNNGTCVLSAAAGIKGPECAPGSYVTLFEPGLHRVYCQRCRADSISTVADSLRCHPCPAPQVPNANQTACRFCAQPFVPNTSLGTCDRCPANYYGTNTSGCLPCPPGSDRPSASAQCGVCTHHRWSPGDGRPCRVCEPNTQTLAADNSTVCVPCTGRTVRFGSEPTCHLCRRGSIWSTSPSTGARCTPCGFLTVGGDPATSNTCTSCLSPNTVIGATVCLDADQSPLTNLPDHDDIESLVGTKHRYILIFILLGVTAALSALMIHYRHSSSAVSILSPPATSLGADPRSQPAATRPAER